MPGGRILVLDDGDSVREMWAEGLERAGYAVVRLEIGAEALARLAEIDPDLILLDMMMPQMDGFEFLARLRASSARPDVPVFILSDLGDVLSQTIDAPAARTLRLAAILPKNTPLDVLVAHVRRAIGPPPESHERGAGR